MKAVLFIAYSFPPAGGAGVQRSLKFVKYLPGLGWKPVVIAATSGSYPVRDPSLLRDVPEGTPIYRIRSFDVNGLRPAFHRLGIGRLLTALNVALLLPDAALLWARLARPAVREAVARHRPCLIYSSLAPASAHLLGMWGQKTFGLPWVADFRDPWSESQLTPYLPGYRAINRHMERQVLQAADRVVTVSQPLAEDLQRLSGGAKQPILVIENGYDQDDVVPLPPQRTERFTITHTGTFSRLRPPDAFVAAVQRLVANGQIPEEEIRIILAGKDTQRYVPNRLPFELPGYLDREALAEVRHRTDLFLLVQDLSIENRRAYSGKLFEYLGSNRPVLAVVPRDGVAAELVQLAAAGTVVDPDPESIMRSVRTYYQAWKTGSLRHDPDWTVIRRYTRKALAARLAAEFDRLMCHGLP